MRLIILLGAVVFVACDAPTSSSEPPRSPPSTAAVSETASAIPVAGVERLCEAFDIVEDVISPTYASWTDMSVAGLAVAAAGADIEELAEGVESIQINSAIRTLGQRFQDEGARMQEGDPTGAEATVDTAMAYYLELQDQYGSDC